MDGWEVASLFESSFLRHYPYKCEIAVYTFLDSPPHHFNTDTDWFSQMETRQHVKGHERRKSTERASKVYEKEESLLPAYPSSACIY